MKEIIQARNEIQKYINKQNDDNFFIVVNDKLIFINDNNAIVLQSYDILKECGTLPQNVFFQTTTRETDYKCLDMNFEVYTEKDLRWHTFDDLCKVIERLKDLRVI